MTNEELNEEANEIDNLADRLVDAVAAKISNKKMSDFKGKIFGEIDVKSDTTGMNKEDKIVNFFGALVQHDQVALKALSEG